LCVACAGFESLVQTAGEVKDSTRRLPMIFAKGILIATVAYFLISTVAFGVLPGQKLANSPAPMVDVATVYLPLGAAWFVGLGAVMALTTSVNATMLVPSRLAIMVSRDRLAPRWVGSVARATGTPVIGLTLTLAASAVLLVSGQISLALNIAVFALVLLYFLHSFALLVLPRANPRLFASVTVRIPAALQPTAALLSLVAMGGLIVLQVVRDAETLSRLSFAERISKHELTTIELCAMWAAIGAAIYALGRRTGARERHDYQAALTRSHASDT